MSILYSIFETPAGPQTLAVALGPVLRMENGILKYRSYGSNSWLESFVLLGRNLDQTLLNYRPHTLFEIFTKYTNPMPLDVNAWQRRSRVISTSLLHTFTTAKHSQGSRGRESSAMGSRDEAP